MPFKVIPQRDRKLNRVLKRGDSCTLRRGAVLYEPGDPAAHLYLVQAGSVRIVHRRGNGEGEEGRVVGIAGPGELLGEEALESSGHRRTGARAGEKTVLTVLDGSEVRRALGGSEGTLGAFLRAKEEELALARALTEPRRTGGASARLARVLLHLCARFGRVEQRGVRIHLRVTHHLLGELAGIHRSTVTTLLNDWAYREVLETGGKGLLLLDRDALAELAGIGGQRVR